MGKYASDGLRVFVSPGRKFPHCAQTFCVARLKRRPFMHNRYTLFFKIQF